MSDIVIAGNTYTGVPSISIPKANGSGNAVYYETPILKRGVLRPDAEICHSVTYDKMLVADEKVAIPAWTTTATTLIASSALTPTYTISYTDYNYFICIRCLTIPVYNTEATAKGRLEYAFTAACYEISEAPAGTFYGLVDPTKAYTSRLAAVTAYSAFSRLIYYSGTSTLAAYSTTSYGLVQAIVAPTLSSGVLTFNSPTFSARGSSTYFSQTYWNATTDARYQYKIEVYRCPKNNYNLNGFSQTTHLLQIADSIHLNNGKLI